MEKESRDPLQPITEDEWKNGKTPDHTRTKETLTGNPNSPISTDEWKENEQKILEDREKISKGQKQMANSES